MSCRYRTIVADPPWDYRRERGGFRMGRTVARAERKELGYAPMALPQIEALPVASLAESDAHLFVWTTQRYLVWTQAVVGRWGFAYAKLLVWCKPPTGFSLGGAFGNSSEFVVYARCGRPETHGKAPRDWWEWPRAGHSVKPEAFLDTVESVCPGPYLELFARRQRLGWETWGDEALEHVTLGAGVSGAD